MEEVEIVGKGYQRPGSVCIGTVAYATCSLTELNMNHRSHHDQVFGHRRKNKSVPFLVVPFLVHRSTISAYAEITVKADNK